MIDVAPGRESYSRFEIPNIGLVHDENNLADALAKPNLGTPLTAILRKSLDELQVVQWIHLFRQ